MAILEVRDLTRRFGGLVAVSALSLSVEEGEIRGLIGPNGAGKTTTFNVISGFYPPSEGRVLFRGEGRRRHVHERHRGPGAWCGRSRRRRSSRSSPCSRTCAWVGRHLKARTGPLSEPSSGRTGRREEAARARAIEILDFFGLGERREDPGLSLPHGLQRALGVAVAFAAEPKLLLLDEPFTGMNPEGDAPHDGDRAKGPRPGHHDPAGGGMTCRR